MTHKCRANVAAAHPLRRRRPGRGVNPFPPRCGLAIRQPFHNASRTARHAVRRIVKVLAVEVVGNRAVIKRHCDGGPAYLSPAACALPTATLAAGRTGHLRRRPFPHRRSARHHRLDIRSEEDVRMNRLGRTHFIQPLAQLRRNREFGRLQVVVQWEILVAPIMVDVTPGCVLTQFSATCAAGLLICLATSTSTS